MLASGERREAAALVGVHPSQVTRARAVAGALRVGCVLGVPWFAPLDGALRPRSRSRTPATGLFPGRGDACWASRDRTTGGDLEETHVRRPENVHISREAA